MGLRNGRLYAYSEGEMAIADKLYFILVLLVIWALYFVADFLVWRMECEREKREIERNGEVLGDVKRN